MVPLRQCCKSASHGFEIPTSASEWTTVNPGNLLLVQIASALNVDFSDLLSITAAARDSAKNLP